MYYEERLFVKETTKKNTQYLFGEGIEENRNLPK